MKHRASSEFWTPIAAGLLLLAAAVLLVTLHGSSRQWACEIRGGKWASARGVCIARDCFKTAECGHWLLPWQWVDRIRPGDSVADVVFWLGEPDKIEGESYYWVGGKPEPAHFKAIIHGGKLVSVGQVETGDLSN